jgi:hypothetical protein
MHIVGPASNVPGNACAHVLVRACVTKILYLCVCVPIQVLQGGMSGHQYFWDWEDKWRQRIGQPYGAHISGK